jgi:hypothetical protein
MYRVYVLDGEGRVSAPPHIIECNDDREAICRAHQYVVGMAVEIWRDATLLARLEPK